MFQDRQTQRGTQTHPIFVLIYMSWRNSHTALRDSPQARRDSAQARRDSSQDRHVASCDIQKEIYLNFILNNLNSELLNKTCDKPARGAAWRDSHETCGSDQSRRVESRRVCCKN